MMAHTQSQTISLLGLFGHVSCLEVERGTSFSQNLWITLRINMGKGFSVLGKRGKEIVVHSKGELSTKLSPSLSTRIAEDLPQIHRSYYNYYFN